VHRTGNTQSDGDRDKWDEREQASGSLGEKAMPNEEWKTKDQENKSPRHER
jgi:hypothetical protein